MKIIVRKSDGVALYAVNAVLQIRDDAIVCDNVIIGDHGALTVDVVEADVPSGFVGGKFQYIDGAWSENPNYVSTVAPEPLPVAPSA
jgi:hypothetical protein